MSGRYFDPRTARRDTAAVRFSPMTPIQMMSAIVIQAAILARSLT
jgi:hypothetical protein